MNTDINLNQNQSQCIVRKEYIGYERHHNICTQTFTDVPWSVLDWAFVPITSVMGLAMLIFFGFFMKKFLNDFLP